MAGILVKALDANTFEVTVEAGSTTTHVVSVSADYAARLTGDKVGPAELVRRSFEFLLLLYKARGEKQRVRDIAARAAAAAGQADAKAYYLSTGALALDIALQYACVGHGSR